LHLSSVIPQVGWDFTGIFTWWLDGAAALPGQTGDGVKWRRESHLTGRANRFGAGKKKQ